MLAVSVIFMLAFTDCGTEETAIAGGALCALQAAVLTVSILFVERALKKTFDSSGNRKE